MASNADNPLPENRLEHVAAASRGGFMAALCGSTLLAMASGLAKAADPHPEATSFSGFYVGVLGQYSHADASFRWRNTRLFDDTSRYA